MRIESFLAHHGLSQNPFDAEEARDDPVFDRLADRATGHPDFAKILGRLERPTSAVIFGAKGSGKTAIRLLIERRVAEHNAACPARKTLLVAYDQLDPVIDQVLGRQRSKSSGKQQVPTDEGLAKLRLADHQDAICSLAVTQLVESILDPPGARPASSGPTRRLKSIRRPLRVDLAVLAALYDQAPGADAPTRWRKLCSRLRLRWLPLLGLLQVVAMAATVAAVGLLFASVRLWGGITAAAALMLWVLWIGRRLTVWNLVRKIHHQMPAIDRSEADLRQMLGRMSRGDLLRQPWPMPGVDSCNSRYEWTGRLLGVLRQLDYSGIMVLVDRVDEPTLVSGNPQHMRSIVWPMLDNKFLQQAGVGIKLLLPLELRHLLVRESPQFFEEARLDKQNLIDRLVWSGSTLYDLCSLRLAACSTSDNGSGCLMDLFAEEVSRDLIIDTLDAMQQPRDAFKFLYGLIQEHCRLVTDDQQSFRIARLTVDNVRRQQALRVEEFQRGLGPG